MAEIQARLNLEIIHAILLRTKVLQVLQIIMCLIPIFSCECGPYLMCKKLLVLMSKKHALVYTP